MKSIRIGNDIRIEWPIVLSGDVSKLQDLDLTVEVRPSAKIIDTHNYADEIRNNDNKRLLFEKHETTVMMNGGLECRRDIGDGKEHCRPRPPRPCPPRPIPPAPVKLPYHIEDNTLIAMWTADRQFATGDYDIILYAHKNEGGQAVCDQYRFVRLVSHTAQADAPDDSGIEAVIAMQPVTLELSGLSAYEVAVINGFQGTEEEWLASLKKPAEDAAEQAKKDLEQFKTETKAEVKQDITNLNANTGVDEYPVFSESEAYSAGDVVNYNGKLYQFTADHAADSWAGSDVEKYSMNKTVESVDAKIGFFKVPIYASTSINSVQKTIILLGATSFTIDIVQNISSITNYSLGITTNGKTVWSAKNTSQFKYEGGPVDNIVLYIPSNYVQADGAIIFNVTSSLFKSVKELSNELNSLNTSLTSEINRLNDTEARLGLYIINQETKKGEYKLLEDIFLPEVTNAITIEVDDETAKAYNGIEFTVHSLLNGKDVAYVPMAISNNKIYWASSTLTFDEIQLSIADTLSINGNFKGKVVIGLAKDVQELSDELNTTKEVVNDINNEVFKYSVDLIQGLQRLDGSISNTDTNWVLTPYIPTTIKTNIFIRVRVQNVNTVAAISYYNSNKEFVNEASYGSEEINGIFTPDTKYAYYRVCGMSAAFGEYKPYVYASEEVPELPQLDFITPKYIYMVCNDSTNSVYNRNYTPCIYLDHFFLNATKESNAYFKENNNVVLPFRFPTTADQNWNSVINDGNDVVITQKTVDISGDINTNFSINVISTKATVGTNKTVRLLCIGTSTTYGEGATFLSKGISGVKPYHAICHELFKMDEVEQGAKATKFLTLGTNKFNLSFNFQENNYSYEDYHEGYRGYTVNQILTSPKFTNEEGKFSILAYLNKYRNYNEDGTIMEIGASNIGTEITSQNINNIRVCTPTHIILQLGANGGGTFEQYQEMINTIKSELPDVIIGLAINDPMGVIFPSKYGISDKWMLKWSWLNNEDNSQHYDPNRHKNCFNVQKIYEEKFDNDNYKTLKVFVLPMFFCSNPTFFASRKSDFTEAISVEPVKNNLIPSGWYPNIHSDIRGHSNYAYQLYSWIKYTLTL